MKHAKPVAASVGLAVLAAALCAYSRSRRTRRKRTPDDWYDLVIHIDDFMSVCRKGWNVSDRRVEFESWSGTIVTVLGEFNKGKTWVLNELTGSKLPSGVNIRTEGLSFKRLELARRELALLDTAGAGSPVKSVTPGQLQQKKAMEKFLRDVVFECADIFMYIVNDISAEEQIQLHSLALSLEQSTKDEKRILVIHNLRERQTAEDMKEARDKIVEMYESTGCYACVSEEVTNDNTGERRAIDVLCGLKEHRLAKYQMHLFIGGQGSPAGKLNPWVFSKIRHTLLNACVKQQYLIQERIVQSCQAMLPKYIEGPPMRLCLLPDDSSPNPKKCVRVIPESKYLPMDAREHMKRIIRLCSEPDRRVQDLQALIQRLLAVRPQLAAAVSESIPALDGKALETDDWNSARIFFEHHLRETTAEVSPQVSCPNSPYVGHTTAATGTFTSPRPHRLDELEAGQFKLKPQPLPYFLSAEQTDGTSPPYAVHETVDALWFLVELSGVEEPSLSFRPLAQGGGFMFTVTAYKRAPLSQQEILRTHTDTRLMGSETRPLVFSFTVPSIFEMPIPDKDGQFPPVGVFQDGLLRVHFRKLPDIEQALSITKPNTPTPTPTHAHVPQHLPQTILAALSACEPEAQEQDRRSTNAS
eukprot:NODE_772_length_2108_cov_85.934005_g734_i0.p1 GENE.NODE_772_length_2108_cov_85.934005_g734_i0~~NODE_772_length_2108_cov_85.934005_g734_i0.p1  ORF type:complete len:642 (+),score=96.86 NODE_772_length_2108_cov_85.934005_g734_i0:54-1979(+)